MSFNFVISFFIGIGVYLIGLLIFFLVKRAKYKSKFKKELKEKEGSQADE